MITPPYEISNEFNLTEILAHFDSNYIFDIINDKLENLEYNNILEEPNVVASFEENFKIMNENFPGDSANIRAIREQVYLDIIHTLCDHFNLEFNEEDDTIDKYTLAFYMYDFFISNRNNIMINFYTSFIINNKDSLTRILNLDEYRKSRDTAAVYGKRIYDDQGYGVISANMVKVINNISTMEITLFNIFQSTYTNPEILSFLDNALADKGDFFKDFYCEVLERPDVLPIIITNIRLALQKIVGDISQSSIHELMSYGGELD